jgi:hypothetical protein
MAINYNKESFLSGLALSLSIKSTLSWLDDFIYVENDDGTYTIKAWKGTYKGMPSTKCVIPDSPLIILNIE